MKLKAIPYQQGTLFVDEQAEISNKHTTDGVKVYSPKAILDSDAVHLKTKIKTIIAQHNLNLDGIPYVELEEDNEQKLIKTAMNKWVGNLSKIGLSPEAIDKITEEYSFYYLSGYKAAQSKKYTEEQVKKAIELAKVMEDIDVQGLTLTVHKFDSDQIIQSLQPKIESVEVDYKLSVLSDDGTYIPNGCKIPITYQKDGETYLKVTKINYA